MANSFQLVETIDKMSGYVDRNQLTTIQRRRYDKRVLDGLSRTQIAKSEGVTARSVGVTFQEIVRKIEKVIE